MPKVLRQSRVPISTVKPHPKNPRSIKREDFTRLKKQIQRLGIYSPLVVNEEGFVLSGNMRLRAYQELGITEVDTVVVEAKTEQDQLEYILSGNDRAGAWDEQQLAELVLATPELELTDYKIDLGTPVDLNILVDRFGPEPEEDEVPEPPKEPKTKLGELWMLGDHRLLCGDATKREDVERLMGGEKADMCFTSPPYNLGAHAKLRGNTDVGKRGNAYNEFDDNQNEDQWLEMMTHFTSIAIEFCEYVFVNVQSLSGNRTALPRYWANFMNYFCDVAIWNKGHAAPQQALRVMNSVFEFIFIFGVTNPNRSIRIAPEFRGSVSNVYTAPPQRKNENSDIHGATFPVHLPSHFIRTFTVLQSSILDPFGGSGTTLIACEQTERKCRMIEIDPHYCDVILTRWSTLTGLDPIREDGATWSVVKQSG